MVLVVVMMKGGIINPTITIHQVMTQMFNTYRRCQNIDIDVDQKKVKKKKPTSKKGDTTDPQENLIGKVIDLE